MKIVHWTMTITGPGINEHKFEVEENGVAILVGVATRRNGQHRVLSSLTPIGDYLLPVEVDTLKAQVLELLKELPG